MRFGGSFRGLLAPQSRTRQTFAMLEILDEVKNFRLFTRSNEWMI
jgi:hypothetical protein